MDRRLGPLFVAVIALAAAVLVLVNQSTLDRLLGTPVLGALEVLAFTFFASLFVYALVPPLSVAPGLDMRRRVFALNALLLILLLGVAALHFRFPVDNEVPWLKAALHGIWFAMLGSIAISFKGVYDHTQAGDWNEGWWLWYLGRPLTGAIVGAMAYLLLQVVNPNSPPSIPVLAVAAFVLGTQESRFFGYLYEVGKLVLTTPDSAQTGLRIANITPNQGKQNDLVLITGSGFQTGATATLGGNELTSARVAPDGTALSGLAPSAVLGPVALIVANPSGAAYRVPNAFTFTS
jgi:hypothetical protein